MKSFENTWPYRAEREKEKFQLSSCNSVTWAKQQLVSVNERNSFISMICPKPIVWSCLLLLLNIRRRFPAVGFGQARTLESLNFTGPLHLHTRGGKSNACNIRLL